MCFVFQAEDGIRDLVRSRGLGDVYKRQGLLTDHPSGLRRPGVAGRACPVGPEGRHGLGVHRGHPLDHGDETGDGQEGEDDGQHPQREAQSLSLIHISEPTRPY